MALNSLQQACTGLGEPEFMMGEIYGLRQWVTGDDVEDYIDANAGRPEPLDLVGHYGHDWSIEDTNVATCALTHSTQNLLSFTHSKATFSDDLHAFSESAVSILDRVVQQDEQLDHILVTHYPDTMSQVGTTVYIDAFAYAEANFRSAFIFHTVKGMHSGPDSGYWMLKKKSNIPPHDICDPQCTCGFYAYTDLDSLQDNSRQFGKTLFGLIKATGRITVGRKGFRAEKAKIVALTDIYEQTYTGEYDEYVLGSFNGSLRVYNAKTMTTRPTIPLHPFQVPKSVTVFRSLEALDQSLKKNGIKLGL